MATQLDPISIARMPEKQREDTIKGVLSSLLKMSPDQAFQALRTVISTLAERATDQEYINWCTTTMRIIASYPDDIVKAALSLRKNVVSSLDKRLANRDAVIIGKVLNMLDDATRQKLMRNM